MRRKQKSRLRVLTALENEILGFLWRWKAANTVTLKIALGPERGWWKFYKIIRNLSAEAYIREVTDANLGIAAWALTKKGFVHLVAGASDLKQRRYQLQSPSHDLWATAFHLGDFIFGVPDCVQLISEQEICAKIEESLPDWVPKNSEHIPDGYTAVDCQPRKVIMAFETELSSKRTADYERIIHFYDRLESVDLVFWLCRDDHLIETITHRIFRVDRRRPQVHNFLRLQDFRKLGWRAVIVWGSKANMSVHNVFQQYGVNTPANTPSIPRLPDAISVFRCSMKSPKGLRA